MIRLAESCRFRDCRHQEEPGCAVQAAIREGRLRAERLVSYVKLQREIAYQQRRGDVRAQQEEQARWKHIHKEMRRINKAREQGER